MSRLQFLNKKAELFLKATGQVDVPTIIKKSYRHC